LVGDVLLQTDALGENRQYDGQLREGATVVNDQIKGRVMNLDGGDSHVSIPVRVANGLTNTAEVRGKGDLLIRQVVNWGMFG
jgi:hypothetical protein